MEQVLTFKQVCNIMNWKKTKGYEVFNKKTFPSFKDGKEWKIQQKDFQKWLDLQSSEKNKVSYY